MLCVCAHARVTLCVRAWAMVRSREGGGVKGGRTLVPDTVYPLLHVGGHELPLARLEVHGLASPFESAVDASHGLGLHANVLVYEPYEHDLLPDAVYPPLHVGVHEAPLSRLELHVPAPPFVGAAAALHALPAQPARRAFRVSAHVKGRSVGGATSESSAC